jgi:hypothetical protein
VLAVEEWLHVSPIGGNAEKASCGGDNNSAQWYVLLTHLSGDNSIHTAVGGGDFCSQAIEDFDALQMLLFEFFSHATFWLDGKDVKLLAPLSQERCEYAGSGS